MPDLTLAAFIGFLAEAHVQVHEATQRGLEKAARIIETEAKAKIGAYQPAEGQFAAWAPLAEATKADRVRRGYPADEPLLRTGELRESISHLVGDMEAAVGSNSEIAEFQEMGTSRIPPRSFLGGAAFRKAEDVAKILGESTVLGFVGRGREIKIE